jgi:hypothetical protein
MLVDNYGLQHKVAFQDPAQLALALGPIAGKFVRNGVLLSAKREAAESPDWAFWLDSMGVYFCLWHENTISVLPRSWTKVTSRMNMYSASGASRCLVAVLLPLLSESYRFKRTSTHSV